MTREALEVLNTAHGQCRLSVTSATELKLSPYNGRNLNIAGRVEQIPSAGVTISNTGLAASTVYYVYAYMDEGDMALELSTTGHETHTNGVEVKDGDASRTLVSMVYTTNNTPGQFSDAAQFRFLLNWYNRRPITTVSSSAGGTVSSTTFAEITSAARCHFLCWADEPVDIQVVGTVLPNTINAIAGTIAGTGAGTGGSLTGAQAYTANATLPATARMLGDLTEGYHYGTGYGRVTTGNGAWTIGVMVTTRG